MRILLLLVACNSEPLVGSPQDLSVSDAAPKLGPGCQGPNVLSPCTSGTVCDYGTQRCICQGTEFNCNPEGCPDQVAPNGASCSPEGLSCYYNFRENYCVDGTWLACGDARGQACQQLQFGPPPEQGSVCCPNDYVSTHGNFCECINGVQCSCIDYHVRCEPCDM